MLTRRCGVCYKTVEKPGKIHRRKGKKYYRWIHKLPGGGVRYHDYEVKKSDETKALSIG